MKKILLYISAFMILTVLVACAPEPGNASTTEPATEGYTAAPSETAPSTTEPVTQPVTEHSYIPVAENLYSISVPVTQDVTSAEDGTPVFTYAYPAMHLTVPDKDVADKIIIDFVGRIEQTRADAQRLCDLALSKDHTAASFEPHRYQVHYDPMRIDQGVLSLHGHITQTGSSAHSGKQCISASYNMVTGDVLTLGSILYHANAKQQLEEMIIASLEQRTDLALFEDFRELVHIRLSADESIYEHFYFNNDGLCFYFSPYEIAPYSSGAITVELAYSELTGIISDAFFPAERVYSKGDLKLIAFDDANLENYNQFTEIVVNADAEKLLFATDSTVQNVSIIQLLYNEAGDILQENCIFAANALSASDAVLIDADFADDYPEFLVCYEKEGLSVSYYITQVDGQYQLTSKN